MKLPRRPKILGVLASIFILAAALTGGQFVARVGATGNSITGTVRTPSNGYASGAFVYATAPSSNVPLYGPVTTDTYGAYTLTIPTTGTFDIHFDSPINMGWSPVVDSSVSVTTNQTINAQFSGQTYTLSGKLTDKSSNPIGGITITMSGQYQAYTDANGNYSITAPAGRYYLKLNGQIPSLNIYSFTLTQSNTTSINLTNGNLTLNLVLQTATMTVTAYNDAGQVDPGGNPSVTAEASSGSTSLYPGDPGTTINFANTYGTVVGNTTVFNAIVGATYAAPGLEAGSGGITSSVCVGTVGGGTYDCLRLPITVRGDVAVDVPGPSPATRTFSGTLTDSNGVPMSGIGITLTKYNDTTTNTQTDANGNFTIHAMPKKYYLTITGGSKANNIDYFTLKQSSTALPIDLTGGDITQNLQVKTAQLTVTARDSTGSLYVPYSVSISGRTNSGTATLYTGDPGETLSVTSTTAQSSTTDGTGVLGSIVGASYAANGLNTTNTNNSLCHSHTYGSYWDCITTAYTVTGSASLNVPF